VFLLVLAVRVGSEDVNNFAWHSPKTPAPPLATSALVFACHADEICNLINFSLSRISLIFWHTSQCVDKQEKKCESLHGCKLGSSEVQNYRLNLN